MITGTPDLAVLDTGLPFTWASVHEELDRVLLPDEDDHRLPGIGGFLATHSGHGLFICGLVQRVAPGLVIDPGKVIDTTGVGDDATITAELLETQAKVINLSLGGYTYRNRPPQALARALARLGHDRVVVAAAGNNNSPRPFWPAALKGVIAVAAYDSRGGGVAKTSFSNHGTWVDVCAPGQDLGSTFFPGNWPPVNGLPLELGDGAGWSGTSFAAPLVAAEIARRVRDSSRSPRQVAYEFLASLEESPWPDELGLIYQPQVDLTVPRGGLPSST
ncbi:S8/S53 family peptidase [Lentzea tibetensis]|uniref:S8/S53 family peptidase n=2 Tax=Lentzea tibetensis TaxID=2591470 RepID=A0A563EL35_9PSEU|nr:S8/S53 family peptidase [Lentzea tibetensis]